MAYRTPYLAVNGADGQNQIPVWGSRLIGVRIVTRLVDESDECTFMFTNKPPYATAPAENTPYSVSIGWSAAAAALGGTYYLKRIHLLGDPKRGEQIHYICRPLEQSEIHQVASQHFAADNGNKTLGDVFKNVFGAVGIGVEVAASVAGLPVPGGHVVQWQQSHMDFATDLANDAGAVVKATDGKIVVVDRNAGQSVSGKTLSGFTIPKVTGYEYDVEIEPRFQYQSVTSTYFDSDAGRLKQQASPDQGGGGAKDGLPHPAADQAHAQTIAKAVADENKRFTGTGLFVIPGEPNAEAGAHPTCSGFPDPIDATKWIAVEVTHDVIPDRGWTTTVETETNPD